MGFRGGVTMKMTNTEKAVREEWRQEHGEEIPEGHIGESDRADWREQER